MANDMLGLSGRTAIVWGGGQGMGEATARRLAEAGARVAVVDLERDRAERVAAALLANGAAATALAADVTSEEAVEATLRAVETTLGPVDVMATVIGIGTWSSLLDMSLEQWDAAIRLNLTGFLIPARAVARSLIRRGAPGAIAGVSSVSGLTSSPNNGGYGVAKAGMINLARTMAVEWGPHGIRVNTVSPGSCRTPRVRFPPDTEAVIGGRLPLGRVGETTDIANGLTYLLSDMASYVTGHTLPVDGGWTSCFLMDKGSRSQAGADLSPLDGH